MPKEISKCKYIFFRSSNFCNFIGSKRLSSYPRYVKLLGPNFFGYGQEIENDPTFFSFTTLILGMNPLGPGNFQYVLQPTGNAMLIAPSVKPSLDKLKYSTFA